MKITVTKVIRELEAKYCWQSIDKDQLEIIKDVVNDALIIVDEILRTHKNIIIR